MRSKRPYYFLAVFVLPVLFLLQNPKVVGPIHGFSLSLLKPVFETGRSISYFFSSAGNSARRFWKTFHAQEDYEARILKLQGQLKILEEAAKENARFQKLLDFRSTLSGRTVAARVIGWEPSSWRKTILIDKGTKDGVQPDMAVLVPEGLVGRVLEVGSNNARVLLLTDPDSRVVSMADQSRAQGVAAGDGSSKLKMEYLELESGAAVEETVSTSGMSGIFPKGIRIGKITGLTRDASGLHLEARVEPFVRFSKLEEVLCLASSRQK